METLVIMGDTVAQGTGSKLDVRYPCLQYGSGVVNRVRSTQTWWSIMERILADWVERGVRVINAGLPGDTTAKGPGRLAKDVLSHIPSWAMLMYGPEDAIIGTTPDSLRENLEKMAEQIQEWGTRVVLVTPTPVKEPGERRQELLASYARVIRELGATRSWAVIDLHAYFASNPLPSEHLFEGWLPDGMAQSAMASFMAGELLSLMGIVGFPKLVLTDYRKIYSRVDDPLMTHHAFTDLTFFKGYFYVAFREGCRHNAEPPNGQIVVLKSRDASSWQVEAILRVEGADNRDPKFLQADGRLIVYSPCIYVDQPGSTQVVTHGFEQLGPGRWGEPFACANCVFWRPKKWHGRYVVAPYHWPREDDAAVKLLESPDGRQWQEASVICRRDTYNNETDLWVEEGQLMAFSRHDPPEGDHYLQVSTLQNGRWKSVSCGRLIQAPCVFKHGDRLFVVGRTCAYPHEEFPVLTRMYSRFGQGDPDVDPALVEKYHHGLRTGIFVMDENMKARQVAELLSAGDSSYPGVVRHGDEYLISDYSMHEYYPPIRKPGDWETPADIYLSRVRIE